MTDSSGSVQVQVSAEVKVLQESEAPLDKRNEVMQCFLHLSGHFLFFLACEVL